MRKFISVLSALSMFFSISTVFAENELKEIPVYDTIEASEYAKDIEFVEADEVEPNAAIDTSEFTEDNVLYKAMQSKRQTKSTGLKRFSAKKAAVQNTETVSTDEVTADFDIVMNFDMSSDMYDFDVNGDKEWLEDFRAIAEQAPDNTRYSVVSSDTEGFTYDLEASIDDVESDNYTGECDIVTMLDDSAAAFDDDSDNRNKVVIATTQTIEDADELEDKLDELRNDNVIPFVFVLNEETDNSLDIDGVYQCATDLELRVAISDLYLSFGEFNVALNNTSTSSATMLETDFKPRHKFNNMGNSDGLKLASMLNMYKCVPLFAYINESLKYDFLETPEFDTQQREEFLKANNKEIVDFPDGFSVVWEKILTQIVGNNDTNVIKVQANVKPVILKNMKRRFPILVKKKNIENTDVKENNQWDIVTSYDNSSEELILCNGDKLKLIDVDCVFDTYIYLKQYISSSIGLYDNIETWTTQGVQIHTKYPNGFTITDETNVKKVALKKDNNEETNINNIEMVPDGDGIKLAISEDCNFVVVTQVTFSSGFPDIRGANREYRIKLFSDIDNKEWYKNYVFKAANIGMVSGDGTGHFYPDNEVSLVEYLRMLLDSVQVDKDTITKTHGDGYGDSNYWGYKYMVTADYLGLLSAMNISLDKTNVESAATENITREKAAQGIYTLLLGENCRQYVNFPTLIYEYSHIRDNYRTIAFDNFTDLNGSYTEALYQLYMNGVMNGYDSSHMGSQDVLKRSQICTIIVNCLFTLDDDIPVIEPTIEGDNTQVERFSINSSGKDLTNIFATSNHKEYLFDISDDNEYYIGTYGEIGNNENVYLTVTKKGEPCYQYPNGLDGHPAYKIKGSGEYKVSVVGSMNPSIGLTIKGINLAQNLYFTQNKKNDKQNPHYYIFIDSPEHIQTVDTIDADPSNTLALFNDLGPGTYTVFAYHHKSLNSSDNGFENEDRLFYDAVFFNNEKSNLDNLEIHKLGLSYYGASKNWNIDRTWNWYNESYETSQISQITNQNNKLWLSDFDSVDEDILISNTNNMGYVWLMMDFEITDGSLSFATMAMKNNSNFKNVVNTESLKASFKDLPNQVIKGKGEFAQRIESEYMEYYIDDSVLANTPLTYNIHNKVRGTVNGMDRFITNTSPLYDDCQYYTPESEALAIEYPAFYTINGEEGSATLKFDTYHSPFIKHYTLPDSVKIGPYSTKQYLDTNERLNDDWIETMVEQDKKFNILSDFIGETNMQGYGVTFVYRFKIINLGSNRKITYSVKLNPDYAVKYTINGDSFNTRLASSVDDEAYTGDVFTVDLKHGENELIIESTEFAGAKATNTNQLFIQ